MLESILAQKKVGLKVKISIKAAVSAFIIALAVLLPQVVHLTLGAEGGVKWLPMYLPVLIGGLVLGWKWGLGIGILSPVVSFAVTSLIGNPMPAATRLPYMAVELAVFAAVSGLFSNAIVKNAWTAFPAVLLAEVAGRASFIATAAVFESVSALSVETVWAQIQTGFIGLILQAVIVPFIVMALAKLTLSEKKGE